MKRTASSLRESAPPLLRASEVFKTYGDVIANRDVTLDLVKGEIHAVLGENGAGKSTFMKILWRQIAENHNAEGRSSR